MNERHQLLVAADKPPALGTVVVTFDQIQERGLNMPTTPQPLVRFLVSHGYKTSNAQ